MQAAHLSYSCYTMWTKVSLGLFHRNCAFWALCGVMLCPTSRIAGRVSSGCNIVNSTVVELKCMCLIAAFSRRGLRTTMTIRAWLNDLFSLHRVTAIGDSGSPFLVHAPSIWQPAYLLTYLLVQYTGVTCPTCRQAVNQVIPSRAIQSIIEVYLRSVPSKARLPREMEQADEIYAAGSNIRVRNFISIWC